MPPLPVIMELKLGTNMRYMEDRPPLEAGTLIKKGQYEIIEGTVNEGGFGRIYRAYGSRVEKDGNRHVVAIKEFYVGASEDSMSRSFSIGRCTMLERDALLKQMEDNFRNEVRILHRLNGLRDRHVPVTHGKHFWDGGRLFYAMTFIDGPTLTEVVSARGALPEETAVDYVTQIGKVLYKAHGWGLMHCDVSPNNIMLQNDFAVLVDFGNARSYNKILTSEMRQEVIVSMGTPGFSPSPKYIGTPQGDTYSLAATLFFLLTGRKPGEFYTQTARDQATAKLRERNVSDDTVRALMRTLSGKDAETISDIRTFLSCLKSEYVFNTLIKYSDYDYDKR